MNVPTLIYHALCAQADPGGDISTAAIHETLTAIFGPIDDTKEAGWAFVDRYGVSGWAVLASLRGEDVDQVALDRHADEETA